ncbi:MAG TPA: hypothetical protein VMK42_17500 [Anaeromyxobacteraceae bacterium]|nr:hypothetical protein [Anaeromyxobacteraceae bacterium]
MASERPDTWSSIGTLADHAREGVAGIGREFRRASRHQRMRIGIVAGWALLSVTALWVACPGSGPTNSLGADVRVLKDSLVGGQQLLVRNESSAIWTDIVLTLDGEWRHEQRTMRPHDQIVLSMSQFRRSGEAAARDFKPRSLSIQCQQGRASFDLR